MVGKFCDVLQRFAAVRPGAGINLIRWNKGDNFLILEDPQMQDQSLLNTVNTREKNTTTWGLIS